MRGRRFFPVALVSAAALSLSGCVAAAIPVVAGGALARTATDGIDARSNEEIAASATAPVGPDPAKAQAARAQLVRLSQGPHAEAMAVAPTPKGPSTAPTTAAIAPATPSAFAEFTRYAQTQAALDAKASVSGADRARSAILRDPANLKPERDPCDASQPVVLIDLDAKDSLYEPEKTLTSAPAIAQDLAALRAAGIAIVWISGASAAYAGDARMALKTSGLDPAGEDQIVMMRYPGDRKQTRREDIAASACLIAIAGDERADFDELFRYLTRPDAALGLELLIGDGWFLVPSLTAPISPPPDFASKETDIQ